MTKLTAFRAPVAAVVPLAAALLAAQDAKGDKNYVTVLRECQGKTDPAQRLNCCDTTVASIIAASNEDEVCVVDC